MFDFISIQYYATIHYTILLLVTVGIVINAQISTLESKENIVLCKSMSVFLLIYTLFFIGYRPISGIFIDMTTYNYSFNRFKTDGLAFALNKGDVFFNYFTYYCSLFVNNNTYFFICACLYILPLYVACKKWFNHGSFYAFFLLIASLSFWAYGTNGIRNGIATSLFVLAISRDKIIFKMLLAALAIGFHKTILLPVLGYILIMVFPKPKYFLAFWLSAIPISLIFGDALQGLFASFIEDDRASYLTTQATENFSSTGFRWDFLLYSSVAIFAGWYYIFKLKYVDKNYIYIYGTYVFTNAFWVMVIKANFSNRFAYLSWFMMAIVIIYPMLKVYLIDKQHQKIAYIALVYFGFTYLMSLKG